MGIFYYIDIIRIKKMNPANIKISVFFFFNMGYKIRSLVPKNKMWIINTDF